MIATAYFNQLAQASGLTFIGDSAGTEPSESVSPVVIAMLSSEGINVSSYKPRHVTPEEFQLAVRTISIGCTPKELGSAEGVEYRNRQAIIDSAAR